MSVFRFRRQSFPFAAPPIVTGSIPPNVTHRRRVRRNAILWSGVVASALMVQVRSVEAQSVALNSCGSDPITLTAGAVPVTLPSGTTRLTLSSAAGVALTGAAAWSVNVSGPGWKPTTADVAGLDRAVEQSAKAGPFVRVDRQGQPVCRAAIVTAPTTATPSNGGANVTATSPAGAVASDGSAASPQAAAAQPAPAQPPAAQPPAAPPPTYRAPGGVSISEACQAEGARAESGAAAGAASRDGARTTVVLFLDDPTGSRETPCYVSRRAAVQGDLILVGVYTPYFTSPDSAPASALWTRVDYQPCPLEPAAPNVYRSEEKQPSTTRQGGGSEALYRAVWFSPRECFGPNIVVKIFGKGLRTAGDAGRPDVTQEYTLNQYDRYRATVQTGVLFSTLQDPTFGLRPGTGDTTLIYNKGPANRGPEYIATIVLYGFPRYLPTLVGGPRYRGRDIIHEQGLADRIGALLGVGLSQPGDHFVAGLTFELLAGVNVVGAWHFAKVHELAGVREGDPFKGTADQIPTETVWRHRFQAGLSLDLRYATQLFAK